MRDLDNLCVAIAENCLVGTMDAHLDQRSTLEQARKYARRKPLAKGQWDKLRPLIEYLYLDKALNLDQVKQIVEDERGFVAT